MQLNAGARDYLSTAEVAAYLGLKERTIYELVGRRQIPCARVTGKLIFPRRLVDRWVESHTDLRDGSILDPPAIVAGSSDPLLEWALRESGAGLAMLFEGSGAGLRRLADGQAVAAGLHLFDEAWTPRDSPDLQPLAKVTDLVLLQWARREQGLVVARGNPLGIRQIRDLAAGRRLVLRQAGAGAQRLLERLIQDAGLDLAELRTVPSVARTEADVAAMIADGGADCGLAIGAVARRFGLDFVPLRRERFDIACRRRAYFEPPLQALFAFARTEAFRAKAEALGCYDVAETGRVEFNR